MFRAIRVARSMDTPAGNRVRSATGQTQQEQWRRGIPGSPMAGRFGSERSHKTKLAIESPIPPSRFICFRGATVDSHAQLKLLGMCVSSYSCSPKYITDNLPEFLEHQSLTAYIPATDPARPVPAGNLLAPPYHPYESDDWMSIGHWAWWEGAAPGDSEDLTKTKEILSNRFRVIYVTTVPATIFLMVISFFVLTVALTMISRQSLRLNWNVNLISACPFLCNRLNV